MRYSDIERTDWFRFMDEGMRDLVGESYALMDVFRKLGKGQDAGSIQSGLLTLADISFHDFSFVVFPIAKAYEGFLKKWFYEQGFIDERGYQSDHFRIGKALNPSLPPKFRGDSWYVFDDISARCSKELAFTLWNAWKQGRNLSFHFFPQHRNFLTIEEAEQRIDQLATAMDSAMRCPARRGEAV